MPHYGSYDWNNPCGTVFESVQTGLALPSGTNSSTTITGTTFTAPRRGLYRVLVNIVFTTGTTGTFTPQIVSQDDTHTVTTTMGLAGTTPSANALFSSTVPSTSAGNHLSASKAAYVLCRNGGTINLAFTTTTAGSGGIYNVYMSVHAV